MIRLLLITDVGSQTAEALGLSNVEGHIWAVLFSIAIVSCGDLQRCI